jgi:hypothetical protein
LENKTSDKTKNYKKTATSRYNRTRTPLQLIVARIVVYLQNNEACGHYRHYFLVFA